MGYLSQFPLPWRPGQNRNVKERGYRGYIADCGFEQSLPLLHRCSTGPLAVLAEQGLGRPAEAPQMPQSLPLNAGPIIELHSTGRLISCGIWRLHAEGDVTRSIKGLASRYQDVDALCIMMRSEAICILLCTCCWSQGGPHCPSAHPACLGRESFHALGDARLCCIAPVCEVSKTLWANDTKQCGYGCASASIALLHLVHALPAAQNGP